MSQIHVLNDHDWQGVLGDKPALIVLTSTDSLRGDFNTQFKKSAQEQPQLVFAQVDATRNPQLADLFQVHDKPVLVGYLCGETLVRRVRPWGTDVILAIELMTTKYEEFKTTMSELSNPTPAPLGAVQDKPFVVTDATFQEAVIDYSTELPVLVDFWAEWCGPCRMVAPIMEKLARDYAGRLRIAKVDTDSNPGLSQAFRIMSIPTIMAFKDGKLVFNQAGAFPEPAFRDLVEQLIALDVKAAMAEQEARERANKK